MKKIICLLLAALCIFALTSCKHTHAFGEWSVVKEATYTEEGTETRACSCGETETRRISKKEKPTVVIPDIYNMDEASAKTVLLNKGLLPKVEYRYDSENIITAGNVIATVPEIGSEVKEDDPVTIIVSKGFSYYELRDANCYIKNLDNVEPFSWEDKTKVFYEACVSEGYLCFLVSISCTSKYEIEFYGNFGSASLTEDFKKTVPVKVVYDEKTVSNKGKETSFTLMVPLDDLENSKPTDIYIDLDFVVNGERETLETGFSVSW